MFAEGQAMLKRIVDGRWLTANGVVALLPANSIGDDIVVYADESRTRVALTWRNLRQQNERPAGKPNYCLADFVAPKASGIPDYLGRVRGHRRSRHRRESSPNSRRRTTTTARSC